jgi:hypothetical protein
MNGESGELINSMNHNMGRIIIINRRTITVITRVPDWSVAPLLVVWVRMASEDRALDHSTQDHNTLHHKIMVRNTLHHRILDRNMLHHSTVRLNTPDSQALDHKLSDPLSSRTQNLKGQNCTSTPPITAAQT